MRLATLALALVLLSVLRTPLPTTVATSQNVLHEAPTYRITHLYLHVNQSVQLPNGSYVPNALSPRLPEEGRVQVSPEGVCFLAEIHANLTLSFGMLTNLTIWLTNQTSSTVTLFLDLFTVTPQEQQRVATSECTVLVNATPGPLTVRLEHDSLELNATRHLLLVISTWEGQIELLSSPTQPSFLSVFSSGLIESVSVRTYDANSYRILFYPNLIGQQTLYIRTQATTAFRADEVIAEGHFRVYGLHTGTLIEGSLDTASLEASVPISNLPADQYAVEVALIDYQGYVYQGSSHFFIDCYHALLKLMDRSNHSKPLSGAYVEIVEARSGYTYTAVSNASGYAHLYAPNGTYMLRITFLNKSVWEDPYFVVAGNQTAERLISCKVALFLLVITDAVKNPLTHPYCRIEAVDGSLRIEVKGDRYGVCRIEQLPYGNYLVSVWWASLPVAGPALIQHPYWNIPLQAPHQSNETTAIFLCNVYPLFIRVVDENDRPLDGASLVLAAPNRSQCGPFLLNATGYSPSLQLPNGSYTVSVLWKASWLNLSNPLIVNQSVFENQPVTLHAPVYDLQVRVIDQYWHPVSNAQVRILNIESCWEVTASTNTTGLVAFRQLPIGNYTVFIEYWCEYGWSAVLLKNNATLRLTGNRLLTVTLPAYPDVWRTRAFSLLLATLLIVAALASVLYWRARVRRA